MKRDYSSTQGRFVNVGRVRDARGKDDLSMSSKASVVFYWMSRDQRAVDNWALCYAQQAAREHQIPLTVVFNLYEDFPSASERTFDFMLRGLAETEQRLLAMNIDFVLLREANAARAVASLAAQLDCGLIVTDFSPLRIGAQWKEDIVKEATGIPVHIVDAHNIVPAWKIPTLEVAARTIRPKLWGLSTEFLQDSFPEPERHEFGKVDTRKQSIDVKALMSSLKFRNHVAPVSLASGYDAGMKQLHSFLQNGLQNYSFRRNDIRFDAQSNLSPHLHFGQISAQRCIMEAQKAKSANLKKNKDGADKFIEQCFIRREVAENFCLYNPKYDSIAGAAAWAQETLRKHATDSREWVYNEQQFEQGLTHDKFWNAAQMSMVKTGKMHGFMRMYWAKKILEWGKSPEESLRIAVFLNDLYSLDGRDPNGYVGIMWCIAATHDKPFQERRISGTIRPPKTYAASLKKYKQEGIDEYILQHLGVGPKFRQVGMDQFVSPKKK